MKDKRLLSKYLVGGNSGWLKALLNQHTLSLPLKTLNASSCPQVLGKAIAQWKPAVIKRCFSIAFRINEIPASADLGDLNGSVKQIRQLFGTNPIWSLKINAEIHRNMTLQGPLILTGCGISSCFSVRSVELWFGLILWWDVFDFVFWKARNKRVTRIVFANSISKDKDVHIDWEETDCCS